MKKKILSVVVIVSMLLNMVFLNMVSFADCIDGTGESKIIEEAKSDLGLDDVSQLSNKTIESIKKKKKDESIVNNESLASKDLINAEHDKGQSTSAEQFDEEASNIVDSSVDEEIIATGSEVTKEKKNNYIVQIHFRLIIEKELKKT